MKPSPVRVRVGVPSTSLRSHGDRSGWTLALAGLCIFTFAIVTYRFPVGEVGIAMAIVGVLLQRESLRAPAALWLVAAFLAWGSVSSLLSPFPVTPAHSLFERVKVLVIFFLVCNILRTPRQLLLFLTFFLACFLLFPLRGAFVNFFVAGHNVFGRAVWNYVYANPNDLAAFCLLAMGASLSIAFGRDAARWLRAAATAATALLLFLILLTQSRGAFIGLLAGFGLVAIRAAVSKPRGLMIAAVLVACAAIVVPTAVWDRLSGISKLTSTETIAQADWEGSAEQRFEIQKVALDVFGDNWLLGVGPGSYPAANALYAPGLGPRDTHNTYLNIAAEAGLPGLLLWLAAVGGVMLVAYRARRAKREDAEVDLERLIDPIWLLRGVVAFLIAGLFGTYSVMSQFYVFLAVLWCAHAGAASQSRVGSGARRQAL